MKISPIFKNSFTQDSLSKPDDLKKADCFEVDSNLLEEIPEALEDPIHFTLMIDPVDTPCDSEVPHRFDRKTIEECIKTNGECPLDRNVLNISDLKPNVVVRNKSAIYRLNISKNIYEVEEILKFVKKDKDLIEFAKKNVSQDVIKLSIEKLVKLILDAKNKQFEPTVLTLVETYGESITELNLSDNEDSDLLIKIYSKMPSLQSIKLKEILDESDKMENSHLEKIEEILLVTEENQGQIGLHVSSLKGLDASCYKMFSDQDMKCLKDSKSLTYLNLSGTEVTVSGIKNIEHLQNLKFLDLHDCQRINFSVMDSINKFSGLISLDLSGIKYPYQPFVDLNLKQISAKSTLTTLKLGDWTRLTDNGLKYLSENFKKLKFLSIVGCKSLTKEGVQKFKQLNPNCEVKI